MADKTDIDFWTKRKMAIFIESMDAIVPADTIRQWNRTTFTIIVAAESKTPILD